jgi:hypothetical protein
MILDMIRTKLDRNLYKIPADNTSEEMVLGNRQQIEITNPNTPGYYKTSAFPQPAVIGMGYVTSAGAKDTSGFFLPSAWSVTKNSTGNYTITHSIGAINKYLPMINLIGSSDKSFAVTVGATSTTIYTFNQAGTATDTAFMFVFYLIS